MKHPLYRPALVIVVGALGFLLAIAFNTTRGLAEARPERASDLVDVVRNLESERDFLQTRLADLRARMGDLEQEAADAEGLRGSFTSELDSVKAAAGLTAVEGPGVEVVLGDSTSVSPGSDPNDFVIHDTEIAAVVNALLAGGAEAVDVNGERIVASTPIRCAGTTVLVNAARLGNPYVIHAIGDPDALVEAVKSDADAARLMDVYAKQFGLQTSIATRQRITVSPFLGSVSPRYISLAAGGGES